MRLCSTSLDSGCSDSRLPLESELLQAWRQPNSYIFHLPSVLPTIAIYGLPNSFDTEIRASNLTSYRFRAKRQHGERVEALSPKSQGQNLAVTVLPVPYWLDSGCSNCLPSRSCSKSDRLCCRANSAR